MFDFTNMKLFSYKQIYYELSLIFVIPIWFNLNYIHVNHVWIITRDIFGGWFIPSLLFSQERLRNKLKSRWN